jgi:LPXTG-site transpeptidase (sortase) family protein
MKRAIIVELFMTSFERIYNQINQNKFSFLVMFFFVFTGTFSLLYALDFYPEPIKNEVKAVVSATTTAVAETEVVTKEPIAEPELPVGNDTLPNSITIDALDKTVTVLNPSSNTVAALDAALLKGVIRHPDSATFGEEGNMFILGHSSYLPTVHNRNFQALNGIQNLKWGDTIRLRSTDTEYVYKVEKTYKVKASGFTVPVAGKGKTLTLATCNSFGSTDDRFIVEATLIKTVAL